MSSSNRAAIPCEAAIYRDEKPVGPLRLPDQERAKASFVEEFNRYYQAAGMVLRHSERSRSDEH